MTMTTSTRTGQGKITRAFERRLGKRVQQFKFWQAMRRFQRELHVGAKQFDPELLAELVYGWGNSWSVQQEFLDACLREARTTSGPILECGSGLSTLLIGTVAQSRGIRVWSLEHDPKYAARVQSYLRKYRINSVTLCMAPLRSFGDFDWYSLPQLQTIPPKISLVVCDGPPGGTRGGRYGLVPVMMDKLRADCTILLDDGARAEEQSIAGRWAQLLGASPAIIGSDKPYIRLQAVPAEEQPLPPAKKVELPDKLSPAE
jgi:hypothetical protein